MGSKRFPRKMMQTLGKYPLIEWVLSRARSARTLDQVVLATSVARENDVLEDVARRLAIATVRGDEDDVLRRYVSAMQDCKADYVVRICADNPFVAPEEVDRLVEFYFDRRPDYAFNHVPRMNNGYPNGLGAEILSAPLLERLDANAHEPRQREHVTLYLWDHAEEFEIASVQAPVVIAFPEIKLDVDTEDDLTRLRRLDCLSDIFASAVTVVASYRALYAS